MGKSSNKGVVYSFNYYENQKNSPIRPSETIFPSRTDALAFIVEPSSRKRERSATSLCGFNIPENNSNAVIIDFLLSKSFRQPRAS
ncbi:hypothetical protein Trydic_g21448 [Trypoxylus dichotomus]